MNNERKASPEIQWKEPAIEFSTKKHLIVSDSSVRLAAAQGLDAQQALADNNSYPFLARCDRLLKTGPTRTNVMDMAIILIFP